MIYPQPSIQLDAPIDLDIAKACFTEKQLDWILQKRISGEITELKIKFIGIKGSKIKLLNEMVAKIKKMTFDDKLALMPKLIESDTYLLAILLGEPQYYFKEILFSNARKYIRLIICKRCGQLHIHKGKGLCIYCYGYYKRNKKIKYGIRMVTKGKKIICSYCRRLKKHHTAGLCAVCYHYFKRKKIWSRYVELLIIKLLIIKLLIIGEGEKWKLKKNVAKLKRK